MTKSEHYFLADEATTAALGRALAADLRAGQLVLLGGGLGAGKTALARAMIRTLAGDDGLEVPSPSFALVQGYATKIAPVLHADLYRLNGPGEMDELGLFDTKDAIVLIEWPERAPQLMERADMTVSLSIPPNGQGREARIVRR